MNRLSPWRGKKAAASRPKSPKPADMRAAEKAQAIEHMISSIGYTREEAEAEYARRDNKRRKS